MGNEFIPHEQALALKKLGFDELCFGYSLHDKKLLLSNPSLSGEFMPYFYKNSNCAEFLSNLFTSKNKKEATITIPLYQQAFRWIREKYNLTGLIEIGIHEYSYKIFDIDFKPLTGTETMYYNGSYNEAELECLKKLIELCSQD